MISFSTPLLLFAAFVILLTVSISVPIIQAVYFLQLVANVNGVQVGSAVVSIVTTVQFGVWGYCTSPIDASFGGNALDSPGQCSSPEIGYAFDSTVNDALHIPADVDAIARFLTFALLVHPFACCLMAFALVLAILVLSRPSAAKHGWEGVTFGAAIAATLFTTMAFAFDIAFVSIANSTFRRISDGQVKGSYGNAVWMVLGATIASWAACITIGLGVYMNGAWKKLFRQTLHRYEPVPMPYYA